MFGPYYGEYFRKLVIGVGTLFNNIYVTHPEDGVDKNIRVPLSYAPKEKFIRRLLEESSISDNTKIGIRLPQLSFAINQIAVDNNRRRNRVYKEYYETEPGKANVVLVEVPVNVNFNLFIYTRHINDTLQIAEQIIPHFNPEYNLKINYNLAREEVVVPLVMLNSLQLNERYDGDFGNRRLNMSSLAFVAKGHIFGPPPGVTGAATVNTITEFDLNLDVTDVPDGE
jgi:hypothetical protein